MGWGGTRWMSDRRFRLYEARGKKWMDPSDRLEILQRIVRDYLDEGYVQTSSGDNRWVILRHPDNWPEWIHVNVDAAGVVSVSKHSLMRGSQQPVRSLFGSS